MSQLQRPESERGESSYASKKSTTQDDERISVRLREQWRDLLEIYDDAKAEGNQPLMEKLSRSIATQAKRITEHEQYEKETLKRDVVRKMLAHAGSISGDIIKKRIENQEDANQIIEEIASEMHRIAEDKETF